MKRFLKSIAILFTAAALLSSVITVSAEERDYTNEYGLIAALGVLPEGITDFSKPASRGDFTEAVMKLCGYENLGQGIIPPYSDIKESDKWYGAVLAAYFAGYIDGNGNFNDAGGVSFYEAADMLTSTIGYVYVQNLYETKNPVMAAHNIGISKGVSLAEREKITVGDMVTLIYNTLFTKIMEPSAYYEDKHYEFKSGNILLTETFDVYNKTGFVEATPLTSLYDEEGCSEGRINIGGEIFAADESMWKYIGRTVQYYYHEGDINTVIYMQDKYDECVFEVDFDDVISLTETRLEYFDGEKNRKENIAKYASFMYNGKLKDFSMIKKDEIQSGKITLTDSDGDGSYNVVDITESIHKKVTGTNIADLKIYTEDKVYNAKPEKGVRKVEIISDGALSGFDKIQTGSLISVEETSGRGLNFIRIYVGSSFVDGSITGISENSISIDGAEYKADTKGFAPKMGAYGRYYIAANGKVAFADLENYVVYGYLYRLAPNGIDSVQAKIFSDMGRWVTLDLNDKVIYNGESKSAEYLITAPELMQEGSFKPQLVAYRVNSEKKLTRLDTADPVTRWSDKEEKAIENADFRRVDVGTSTINYRSALTCFNYMAFLNEKSYIFVIPGKEGDSSIDTSQVYLASTNSFVGDRSYSGLCFYDMDEWGNAGAVVKYGLDDMYQYDEFIYPVTGTKKSINENGVECDVVTVMFNGYEIDLMADENVVADGAADFKSLGIKKGDVIRYSASKDGNIGKIDLVYRTDDKAYDVVKDGEIQNNRALISGTIEAIDISTNKMIISHDKTKYILDLSEVQTAYRFDSAKEKIKKVSMSEAERNVKMIASVRYGKIRHIVMYD